MGRAVLGLLALVLLLSAPAVAEPLSTDAELIEQARARAARGEYEAAVGVLRQGLNRWPDHHDLLLTLGLVRLWQGDFREALRLFDRCLELVPGSVEALEARYDALARAGEYEAAGEAIEQLGPHQTAARLEEHRLQLLLLQGRWWDARTAARLSEKRVGPTPTSRKILEGPLHLSLDTGVNLEIRPQAPLLGWNALVMAKPTSLVRFWGEYQGSTWLGDAEHFWKGGARFQTPAGFTALVAAGGAIPGRRVPCLELEGGIGFRTPRELELDFGYVFRLFRGSTEAEKTVMQLIRVGAVIPTGPRANLALYGYLALVQFLPDQAVLFGPGSLIRLHVDVVGSLFLELAYTNGTELFPVATPPGAVDPFRIERFWTHRMTLKGGADVTERVALTASYSLDMWAKPQLMPHPLHRAEVTAHFEF